MRALFAFCMIVTAIFVWANPVLNPHAAAVVRSEVIKAQVKKGATVTIKNAIVRTFGTPGGSAASATGAQLMGMAHPIPVKMTVTGDIRIPKASGTNALTVAEIITRSAELKDQTVVVRGKVVKYNSEIMGKNWAHLRDGTGSTVDNTNDLLVTTTDEARIGDVVTAKGVVRTDEDFGSGYSYKVLIEEATLHEQQSAAR